jgi:putative Ca2+/H+ antiporter (TMEM165/GDT1 family)
VIALGELPDKTMFANLVMATRGRPLQVWAGAAAAFTLHVAIAVALGEVLVAIAPRRVVDLVVGVLFLAGAVYSWRRPLGDDDEGEAKPASGAKVVLSAFVVIFLAEWGDLTQLLIAELAARYRAPLAVGAGSLAALLVVAALAVSSGRLLLRVLSVGAITKMTAAALVVLAGFSFWSAAR